MQVSSAQKDTFSLVQLIFSIIGLALSFLGAGLFAILGIAQVFSRTQSVSQGTQMLTLAWVLAWVGLITLLSAGFALMRVMGRSLPLLPSGQAGYRLSWLLMLVVWPLLLAVGNFVVYSSLQWLILPPITLLVVIIPIGWVIEMARHSLAVGSPQRQWGVLATSLYLTVPLAMVVEVIVFGVALVVVVLVVMLNPSWAQAVKDFSVQLQSLRGDSQAVLEALQPYLSHPLTLFALFAALSGVAPLIEELLKPFALWLLIGKRLSAAQGFVLGAMCGGMFALLESSLNLVSITNSSWLTLVIGRAGTGLLHITTTAMIGWALALAWQNGSYLRLALTYLFSATLHGLWNGLNIMLILPEVVHPAAGSFLQRIVTMAPVGLGALLFLFLVLLFSTNSTLRRDALIQADIHLPPA